MMTVLGIVSFADQGNSLFLIHTDYLTTQEGILENIITVNIFCMLCCVNNNYMNESGDFYA